MRFFLASGNGRNNYTNPWAGTLVDSDVVAHDYRKDPMHFDFHLIPHKIGENATAKPVTYKCLINATKFEPLDLMKLTHDLCFGYFGFSGPVKLPAPVMHAKKVVEYCLENKVRINMNLNVSPYYL